MAGLAGTAVRGGVGAVFFGAVVADGLGAHDGALIGHLHRAGDDTNLDVSYAPSPSGPVHGSGERHLSAGIDHAGHHDPVSGRSGRASAMARHRSWDVGFTALHVGGDQYVMRSEE